MVSVAEEEAGEEKKGQMAHRSHSAMRGFSEIPVIDLSKGITACVPEIRAACVDVGFFYIVNHSVPVHLMRDAMRLSREFFAMPAEDKEEIDTLRSPHVRGWSRVGMEKTLRVTDMREQVGVRVLSLKISAFVVRRLHCAEPALSSRLISAPRHHLCRSRTNTRGRRTSPSTTVMVHW